LFAVVLGIAMLFAIASALDCFWIGSARLFKLALESQI